MDSDINKAKLQRRTLRIAVGAMFFMAGLCFSSWASRIATVQQKLDLTDAALGAVLFSLPVGLFFPYLFLDGPLQKLEVKRFYLGP